MATAPKGDTRAAAERIEEGIERYGEGDFSGAQRLFQEALTLSPDHPRATIYLAWADDVVAGKRKVGPVAGAAAAPSQSASPSPSASSPSLADAVRQTIASPPEEVVTHIEAMPNAATMTGSPDAARTHWDAKPAAAPVEDEFSFAGIMEGEATNASTVEAQAEAPTFDAPAVESAVPLPPPPPARSPSATLLGLPTPPAPSNAMPTPDFDEAQLAELMNMETTAAKERPSQPPPSEMNLSNESDPDIVLEAPIPARASNDTSPLGATAFEDELDFSLPPLEAAPDNHEQADDPPAAQATNPFIRSDASAGKLAQTMLGSGPMAPAPPPKNDPMSLLEQAKSSLDRGDPKKALEISEGAIEMFAGVESDGARPHRALLEAIYLANIGRPSSMLQIGKPSPNLDPRSAFLLSRLDGSLTVDDVLDISGMPRLEALRTIALMVRSGSVIAK